MMHAGGLINKYSKALLENKQQAILFAVALSILPFASWLSVALVSLVTLRKGAKCGFEVMLPALVVHSVPLLFIVSVENAVINTIVAYLPCYFAALVLRKTSRWEEVCGVFLLQAFLGFLLIQLLAPDFTVSQFNQFKSILSQHQEYKELIDTDIDGISSYVLAQLFFGLQILGVIVSALISLLFARSVQAKLFVPGGFGKELSAFRCGRVSLLILISTALATYYEISCGINLLPMMLTYFLVSGFSLAYYILAGKRQVRIAALLVLLILLKPTLVLFAYIVFGILDSIFNFRLYLPARAREST